MAIGAKTVLLYSLLAIFISLFITHIAFLSTKQGQEKVANFACTLRQKTFLDKDPRFAPFAGVIDVVIKLGMELPLFISFKGNRLLMFKNLADACGPKFPMQRGIAYTTHADVSRELHATRQDRGHYIAAQVVPDKCMGLGTLIFVSTGPAHTRLREFFIRAFSGFSPKGGEALFLPPGFDANTAPMDLVRRVTVQNLYARMFLEVPSESDTDGLMEYLKWGSFCVLGESVNNLIMGYATNKVEQIRNNSAELIRRSKGGKEYFEIATQEGMSPEEIESNLIQITDGFMFAGMFGTTHLVTKTMALIRTDPIKYVAQFKANPKAFLLESSRVDPPVTSVTSLFSSEEKLEFGRSYESTVTSSVGMTKQLLIVNANTDPLVFGGPDFSVTRANEFDPTRPQAELDQILTFNGLFPEVDARRAPRGCLGVHLVMNLAAQYIGAILPDPLKANFSDAPATVIPKVTTSQVQAQASKNSQYLLQFHRFHLLFEMQNPFDTIGFAIWWVACFLGFIYCYATPGLITSTYKYYCLGQMCVCAGFLFPIVQPLSYLGQVVAALAYSLISCSLLGVFERSPRSFYVLFVTAAAQLLIIFGVYVVFEFKNIPVDYLDTLCRTYYCPPALLALYSLWHEYRKNPNNQYLELGFYGGLAGVLNLIWPSFVVTAKLWHLASRLGDSLLYLPLALSSMSALNRNVPINTKSGRWVSTKKYFAVVLLVIVMCIAASKFGNFTDGDVCPYISDELRAADKQLDAACEDGKSIMNIVDSYCQILFRIVKMQHHESRSDPQWAVPDPSLITLPSIKGELPKQLLSFGMKVPIDDPEDTIAPNTPAEIAAATAKQLLQQYLVQLPITDVDQRWESLSTAKRVLAVASGYGADLPASNMPWDTKLSLMDPKSDEVMSAMAFAGLAAHRLIKVGSQAYLELAPAIQKQAVDCNATFLSDFTWMEGLETRIGFERYGAVMYFNAEGTLLEGYWCAGRIRVHRGDENWEHAKLAWRSSVVVGVTLVDHLTGIHMMFSNIMATASFEQFSPTHPLRRFLRPFTFRTLSINKAAIFSLLGEKSLLHRATALTWDGLKAGFLYSFKYIRYESVSQRMKYLGVTDSKALSPFWEDIDEYYAIVRRFVTAYVDVYYPNETSITRDPELDMFWQDLRFRPNAKFPILQAKSDVVDLFSSMVHYVTAIHLHVGNVAAYLMDPRFTSCKLRPRSDISDVQASFQSLLVALLTGWKVPMLLGNDYTHLLLKDEHQNTTKLIFDTFQAELKTFSELVESRNALRRFPSNSFNPRFMTTSVSI